MKVWIKPIIDRSILKENVIIIYEKHLGIIDDAETIHINVGKVKKIKNDFIVILEDNTEINHMCIRYYYDKNNRIEYKGNRFFDFKKQDYVPTMEEFRKLVEE